MKRPETITIVGAGLVGSLLAVLLGRRGYRVTVLERRPDMRDQPIPVGRSINLALSERGIYALRTAQLMHDVEPLLIPMRGRMLHELDGQLEFLPYGQRPHEVIFSVSRGELNRLMMSAAETSCQVEIQFEQKSEAVDFENKTLRVTDRSNGQTRRLPFELLIGADGAGSRVRRALIPAIDGQSSSEFLDHDYKELNIPPAASGRHQIEKEALHIWPRGGFMLIALPNTDGSFTVTLFLNKTGHPSFEELTDAGAVNRLFQEQFPDALELIPSLADEFFENPQGLLGTVRCRPWFYPDTALILGDASHAIVPFHGQGMNAGFEDCSELIKLLDQYDDDWSLVLPEFDRRRKPNTEAIADMALENYVTMRDSVRDPRFQLMKEIGFKLERQFPDRFIPRYSMIMFHRIPYADALRRGEIQAEILERLIDGKTDVEHVDFHLAEKLVMGSLPKVSLA